MRNSSDMGTPQDFVLNSPWRSIDEIVNVHQDKLRLDLGCGYTKPDGYVGLDNGAGVPPDQALRLPPGSYGGPDVILDINRVRWPFPSATCVEVRARHFLEHSILDHVFLEVWRVLLPGGPFVIIVPYANSAWGMFPGQSIFLTERFLARSQ